MARNEHPLHVGGSSYSRIAISTQDYWHRNVILEFLPGHRWILWSGIPLKVMFPHTYVLMTFQRDSGVYAFQSMSIFFTKEKLKRTTTLYAPFLPHCYDTGSCCQQFKIDRMRELEMLAVIVADRFFNLSFNPAHRVGHPADWRIQTGYRWLLLSWLVPESINKLDLVRVGNATDVFEGHGIVLSKLRWKRRQDA